ncbi:AAA family ATPase [Jeotgalibaca porci]|uniref:AAA family ATPase n=1 Tax=Jeotgalibaca porci TaxID=1868793 RepID=A0A6G7WF49_9LACT|nr:AAA family ATPase [Jeotgalibaca porci]QIK50873.1 AAA family ATPase [Jeotgalibaca porci]
MYLEKMRVQNFRMLENVEIPFLEKEDDELSLIVGKNNTGKTSILKILERILPGTSSDAFEWDDFTMKYQKQIYSELGTSDRSKTYEIRLVLYIKYTDNDSYDLLRPFMMDLDENNQTIILECLYRIKEEQILKLEQDIEKLLIEEFDEFTSYMRRNLKKYFKFDYFAVSACGKYKEEATSNEIKRLIRLRRIKANRDISNKSSDHSLSNISDRLYRLVEDTDDESFVEFQKAIKKTDSELTETYSNVFSEVIGVSREFGALDDMEIEILSTIQEKDLLRDNTTLFYNKDDVYLPESYNGLGYLNLIGMIFEIEAIATEFEKKNLDCQGLNLLFIEEPEAHTHPQLQYVFIKNIKNLLEKHGSKNIQTIMTTHSSHIVSDSEFEDVIYLTRINGYTEARAFRDLNDEYSDNKEAFDFIKKHLHLTRAELFFADKTILIEGDTERILLQAMMKKVDENIESDDNIIPLSSQNVSVVEVGAHAHIFKHLMNFLNVKTLVITDLDYGERNIETKRIKKCDYIEADHVDNTTITNFLEKQNKDLDEIINLSFEQKVKGNHRIAYQTKEDGITKEYPGRSFEEAFININFEFIEKYKDVFISLKNVKDFTKEKSPYELANNCIDKKTTFATDLLYYDNGWEVPNYIEEGLIWLRKY